MNRLRREAEFHWRLEPYAGKLARTVFRGEDGSNVIFLLDVYKCSESLRSRKAKQYPTHYKDSRTARYKDDIAKKKIWCGIKKLTAYSQGFHNKTKRIRRHSKWHVNMTMNTKYRQ